MKIATEASLRLQPDQWAVSSTLLDTKLGCSEKSKMVRPGVIGASAPPGGMHHKPRHSVVSSALGRRAAHEFLETRALPKCFQWQEL
jgi:hypothetical protein